MHLWPLKIWLFLCTGFGDWGYQEFEVEFDIVTLLLIYLINCGQSCESNLSTVCYFESMLHTPLIGPRASSRDIPLFDPLNLVVWWIIHLVFGLIGRLWGLIDSAPPNPIPLGLFRGQLIDRVETFFQWQKNFPSPFLWDAKANYFLVLPLLHIEIWDLCYSGYSCVCLFSQLHLHYPSLPSFPSCVIL